MGQRGKIIGLSLLMILCIFSLFTDVKQLSSEIISVQPKVFIWLVIVLSLLILFSVLAMILPLFLNHQRFKKGKEVLKNARNEAKQIMEELANEKTSLKEEFRKKNEALQEKHEQLKKEHAEKLRSMKKQNIELKETVAKLMNEYKKLRGK